MPSTRRSRRLTKAAADQAVEPVTPESPVQPGAPDTSAKLPPSVPTKSKPTRKRRPKGITLSFDDSKTSDAAPADSKEIPTEPAPEETAKSDYTDKPPLLDEESPQAANSTELGHEQETVGTVAAAANADTDVDRVPAKIMIGEDVVRVIIRLLKLGESQYKGENATYASSIITGFGDYLNQIGKPLL
jgi:hypothetical protein